MRPYMLSIVAASFLALGVPLLAQEKTGDLPPRYQALAKGRMRLERILGTPELQPAFNPTVAISGDGKRAVYVEDLSTGPDDKPMLRSRLIVTTPQSLSWPREIEVPGKHVSVLALSKDGKRALIGGLAEKGKAPKVNSHLSLWDLDAGKEINSVLVDDWPLFSVILSFDEGSAITCSIDFIKRWDLKDGKELASYGEKGKTHASALAFLPGGKQFLAGMNGGEVHLFDVDKSKPLKTYKSKTPTSLILQLVPSADGKRFVASDFPAGVTLWETATGKEIGAMRDEKRTVEEAVTAMTFADDGKTVLMTWAKSNPDADDTATGKLYAWDGDANKVLWSHVVPYRGRLPILAQGNHLLIGGGANLFEVWNWKQGTKLQSWGGHKGTVNALAVMRNSDILSAGQEGSMLYWRKGSPVGKTVAHQGAVVCMTMSRDQKQWLTAGTDQTIKLWNEFVAKPVQELKGHAGAITSLAFSSDGKLAATGSGDRTAKIWDLATGKEIASFAGHSEGVNAVAISPDDRWLATGSEDTTIRVWPIKDGKPDASREAILLEKHTKPVTCLLFTPDGKSLLSGSQDQKLMSWNWQKGSMDFMIPGHKNWINSILLLDAKTVLTSSDDLSVCAWDLATGMEIGRIDFGAIGDCPRCLARLGGDRFVVGTSSWMVYEFQLAPGKSTKGVGSSLK